MNTRFLCTEVVGRKLTQLFIRTKNDIGSNGTSIVDTTLSPALSDVHVSLMPRLVRYHKMVLTMGDRVSLHSSWALCPSPVTKNNPTFMIF